MSAEDSQRGGRGNSRRLGGNSKYNDSRNANYSPSASFNYNRGTGNYMQPQHQQQSQHPRRRTDRFKREAINHSDKIVKQNDTIIRLLKEIRDRLPAPEKKIVKDIKEAMDVVEPEQVSDIKPAVDTEIDDSIGNTI